MDIISKLNNYGYTHNGKIIKEYSNLVDGYVYKNENDFNKKTGICYINTFDEKYTYEDFLEEAEGNETLAKLCFDMMVTTWNFPDSYFDDGVADGYIKQCECGYVYDSDVERCPKCNSNQLL